MEDLIFHNNNIIVRSNGDKVRWTAVSYYDRNNPATEAYIPQGGFHERIEAGAFDEYLSRSDADIVATIDHDLTANGIIGRTPTTLELFRTATGIDAEVTLPKSMRSRVIEMIERNEIRGGSFIAAPSKHYSRMSKEGDKRVVTIRKFDALREVSLVFQPAYKSSGIKRSEWHAQTEAEYLRELEEVELIQKIRGM